MPKNSSAHPSGHDVAVAVDAVSKTFTIRHTHSLKEMAVYLLKRRPLGETFKAVNDVSFTIARGETVALMGLNGSGKSTMLKLISGVLVPDEGRIGLGGSVAGLIEVGAGFHPDLTGRENVYLNAAILGMDQASIDAAFDDIVAFSEIERFIDQEVKFYSSGMFLRLAFSVAVHTQPEIFLVDEILSVGDEPFQNKCLDKIRELSAQGRTLVIVSHDLDKVADLCSRAIVLENGVKRFDGDAHEAVEMLRRGEVGRD